MNDIIMMLVKLWYINSVAGGLAYLCRRQRSTSEWYRSSICSVAGSI